MFIFPPEACYSLYMKTTKPVSQAALLKNILENIKVLSGRMVRSHHELRHCSRCGKALSDPSSWERGIGPLCAAKDTALFARTIQNQPALVSATVLSLNAANLPAEVRGVWANLKEVVIEKMLCEMEKAVDVTAFALSGEDCRLVAKVIDWMLSFRTAAVEKNQLINIVKYLGFAGLAGVLAGKASTGASKIEFVNGRLSLTGSSNKLGFMEMKKIPGVTLPRYRGSKEPYTVPANQHEKFFAAALEFWPMFDEDVPGLRKLCTDWIVANPERVEVKANYSDKPVAKLVRRPGGFSLNFAWVRGVSERIVGEIKGQIPSNQRSYDPGTYTWFFKTEQLDKVMVLVGGSYVVETTASNDPMPDSRFGGSQGTYRASSYSGGGYRRNWHRG